MTTTTDEPTFVGNKLRLARNFNDLTQVDLAQRASVTHSTIHHLEAEIRQPSKELVAALSHILGFAPSFFFKPVKEEFREDECQFRGKGMSATLKTRVLAYGTLFGMFVRFADRWARLPRIYLPDMADKPQQGREGIERAAEDLRRSRGLGLDRPITSMCRVLENMGAVVTRFAASTESSSAMTVDAFSRVGSRPVVVLNTDKDSTSRTRWDMAHELGHLLLHRGLRPDNPTLEEEADFFASSLLLPRVGFLREFPQQARLSWDTVFAMKRRWKASAASIVRRAFELGRIDAAEYRRAWKHYSYRGWRLGEPDEPADEPPEIVPLALDVIEQSTGATPLDVARALGWSAETFERVLGVSPKPLSPQPEQEAKVIPLLRQTA
ncbi:MAG: ImmA/IrrE family metallo-endopeptidase [Hyalangium sp.]|uniref:ImmA/IrrE family metallo-endopeptidase n=1 Tax=Hyalangium sp. TaxID=2028555 RepID=UPI00389A5200